MTDELSGKPALEIANLVRNKQISPLELTESYLDRIDRLDPEIGAFVHVARESAIARAREQSDRLVSGDASELPPFFGIPTGIKDLNSVAAMPINYGIAGLRDRIGEYDEAIVTRMRGAGFILLGKTATSQLGSLPYTENPGFLPVRNPRNPEYTAGGSSGGAAAAVAAGFCPIAPGSDGGGSIRIPAACCGLVGLKPSRGRVSFAPIGEYQSGIATNGVISRTVADAAALLDVISGYTTGDPYWLPDPPFSFLEATERPVNPRKIAFATSIAPFGATIPEYRDAVLETARRLEELGHAIEETDIDVEPLIDPFRVLWQAGAATPRIPLPLLSPINQWLATNAGTAGEYLQAVTRMHVFARRFVARFESIDLLLLPVLLHRPPKIGEWADLEPEETVQRVVRWIAPCPIANATGLPAIALPAGVDSDGVPIGVQLVGKPADEITLLGIAARLEEMKNSAR